MSQDPLGKPGFRVARQELSYSQQQTILSQTKLNIIFAIFAGTNMSISSAAQSILYTGGGLAMLLRYSIGDSWHDMIFKSEPNIVSKLDIYCFRNNHFFEEKKTIRWDSGGIPLRVTLSPAFLGLKSKAGYR